MKTTKSDTIVMIIPWIIVFLVFWIYPLLFTGYLSLTKYNTLTDNSQFIAFENYAQMFSDEIFFKALKNTVLFTVGTVPFSTGIALLLAAILNSKLVKYKDFFKTAFFLPSVTSLVVISLIFTNLYARNGYVNLILSHLGLPFPEKGWLLDKNTSLFSIMLMDIWAACGYYMVIFIAAMQAVPQSLYDAAKLAGANSFYILRKITIPMINPTIIFVLVINMIKSFQVFMEIYIMTKGGPLDSTKTLVYMIFSNAFEKTDSMGYAAAISYFLFFLLLIFSFFQLKFAKNK